MVSNSEIELFKRCRRKWWFGSFNTRNLIPRIPNLKFWLGTAGHYALERHYGYGEDALVAFRRWVEEDVERIHRGCSDVPGWFETELDNLIVTGETIISHYLSWTHRRPEYRFKYIATEYEFSVPIPGTAIALTDDNGIYLPWVVAEWGADPTQNEQFIKLYVSRGLFKTHLDTAFIPALYIGRLDGLVEDNNGHVKVIDHKFMASLVDSEYLLRDRQTARYVWAATESIKNGWWPEVAQGTPVRGALYNVVRKKAPVIPPVLAKSGTTSVNKNIDTTAECFRATLVQRGENPEAPEFKEVLHKLRNSGTKFFQLLEVERGEEELALTGANMYYEYMDMTTAAETADKPEHPILYPSPNLNCAWDCSFKKLCYFTSIQADVEYLIEIDYIHQKRTAMYATQLEESTGEVP